MSTPSIQTLITQAQQVLNLKSSNEIRATLAAVLANANVGTPLNPNLTTQQLWDEFYEIVRQPSDDIMSIITDQMMRMVFSPPAPGGAGADKQVIFNDGGVLAGDPDLIWNRTLNFLTVTGSANITADLTVDGGTLKVDSTNNFVGINKTPVVALDVSGSAAITGDLTVDTSTLKVDSTNDNVIVGATSAIGGGRFSVQADLSAKQAICAKNSAASYSATNNFIRFTNSTDSTVGGITHPAVTSLGVWGVSDIQFLLSGAATTGMTLNSTGNLVLKGGTAAANGIGVAFPATQSASSDANCLDDYEEGTWVGTLKGSVSDPTVAVTATGKYTKVGRQVTVSIYYNNVSTVGASGNVTIDGLPFTGSESFAGSSITFGLFTTSTTLACWNVSTSIAFYITGNFVQATHSPGTGKYLTTTITYFV